MHPLRTSVGPVFFLPDRDDFLNAIHHPLPRLESILPMGRADRDSHRDVSQLQMPHPMHDGRLNDRPAGLCLIQQLVDLLDGHLRIRLVVERLRSLPRSQLTHGPQKQHHSSRLMRPDLLDHSSVIDGRLCEFDRALR